MCISFVSVYVCKSKVAGGVGLCMAGVATTAFLVGRDGRMGRAALAGLADRDRETAQGR